ncbi:MAG: primosomal protein N' [Anaerolineaceae bacterium]|nr:primosomal protein N' [Anaerolineaceae bacterium]
MTENYFQIAVNLPQVSGVFDYHLPQELAGQIQPGSLVVVPFGKQTLQGIVLQQVEQPAVAETKAILALLDPQPVVTPLQIELAKEIARASLAPLSVCLDLMLPPGLSQLGDTLYELEDGSLPVAQGFSALQLRLLELLTQRGALRGRQLDAAFPHQDWKKSAQVLIKRGRLRAYPALPPPTVRPKVVRTVQLSCTPARAQASLEDLGRGAALARRQAILKFLIGEPMPVEVAWAYAAVEGGGSLADLEYLADKDLVVLGETEIWRDPLDKLEWVTDQAPVLTVAQQSAWQSLEAGFQSILAGQRAAPYLLYGVTGSGKTEIYLRAVAETLRQGRQAIVLVPEIALTPQTVRRFVARFPGQVGLVHSELSAGERYDTWRKARAGLLPVIVGPRSALFMPLPKLGLVVIDECHDDSFYQSEGAPFYHSVQVAISYTRQTGSLLLMGSATPGLNLFYRAQREKWNVLHLPDRILAHRQSVQSQMEKLGLPSVQISADEQVGTASLPLPPVRLVDMRQELKEGNRSIFSRQLQESLASVLENEQQAILFLNRRGSSSYIFCRSCGQSLRCPRCDFPLTYHSDGEALTCHLCGYRRQMPRICPQCGSAAIRQMGIGTEKVESELQALFPQARILRWDAETTRQKGSHDLILSHFSSHHADFLVGTQMLAKGLDLALVTLVGVILAEVGLNLPDYRASERVFQLLTQVAGRAGRSSLGGQVIMQTFQPEHYVLQAAAKYDFDGFYADELEKRRQIGYPPFCRLARLEFRHVKNEQAEQAAQTLSKQLQGWIKEGGYSASEIIGPAPCFFSRLSGYYRWQVILRSPDPAAVLRGRALQDWRVEIDPVSVL